MANSGLSRTEMRAIWKAWECNESRLVRVRFPTPTGFISLRVADKTAPAWNIFASIMAQHGVLFKETAGGTYNCRPPSLHANGLAIDINPRENPQGGTSHNFPSRFLAAVEEIRCGNGIDTFRWGIVFENPDPMHFEINCRPSDLATGVKGGGVTWKSEDGYTYETDDWDPHENGIKWMINEGLMVGKRDTQTKIGDFMAQDSLTRAEFATIMLRTVGDAGIKDEIEND